MLLMYTSINDFWRCILKRTQIYLTEYQKDEMNKLASRDGKALAQTIREAVDMYIVDHKKATDDSILKTSGIWKNRDDIDSVKYVEKLRNDLNSRLEKNKNE
jgi:hypothetical protein